MDYDDETNALIKRFIQIVSELTPERRTECLEMITDISECYVNTSDKQAVVLIVDGMKVNSTSINASFEEASEIVQSIACAFWETQKDMEAAKEGSH